jgi:hypothetical protein
MSMNYEFSSSELSNEILLKLIPLIPLFKQQDLYILLITISKIMKGRDDNKMLFMTAYPNMLGNLLDLSKECKGNKDIILAILLILKECFIK